MNFNNRSSIPPVRTAAQHNLEEGLEFIDSSEADPGESEPAMQHPPLVADSHPIVDRSGGLSNDTHHNMFTNNLRISNSDNMNTPRMQLPTYEASILHSSKRNSTSLARLANSFAILPTTAAASFESPITNKSQFRAHFFQPPSTGIVQQRDRGPEPSAPPSPFDRETSCREDSLLELAAVSSGMLAFILISNSFYRNISQTLSV